MYVFLHPRPQTIIYCFIRYYKIILMFSSYFQPFAICQTIFSPHILKTCRCATFTHTIIHLQANIRCDEYKEFFDACELQLQMFFTSFLETLDSSFPPLKFYMLLCIVEHVCRSLVLTD